MSILIYGSIWWLVIFLGVFSLSFVPGAAVKKENQFFFTSKGLIMYFVFISIVSFVIGYLFHLKNSEIGFGIFGLSVCLISIFLDSIITVPFFVKNYQKHFLKWSHILGYVVSFAVLELSKLLV